MRPVKLLLILSLAGCMHMHKPSAAPAPTTSTKPSVQPAQQPSTPKPASSTACKPCPNDSAVAALKEQLAKVTADLEKTSAELERIKKRLANPE